MPSTSITEKIEHYQRNILKHVDDESRLIHCLQRLRQLPVTVKHLQSTGIGRTVNSLRKNQGESGSLARALVNNWKQMVVDDDKSGEDEKCNSYACDSYKEEETLKFVNNVKKEIESPVSQVHHSPEQDLYQSSPPLNGAVESINNKYSKNHHSSDTKKLKETSDRHKHERKESKSNEGHVKKESSPRKRKLTDSASKSDNKKHKSSESSKQLMHDGDSVAQHKNSSSNRSESIEKNSSSNRSKSIEKNSSKDKKDQQKNNSDGKSNVSHTTEKKKDYNSSKKEASSSKSKIESSCNDVIDKCANKKEKAEKKGHSSHNKSVKDKDKKPKVDVNLDQGIDCNSGTSFGDALGMCNIPVSNRKRMSNNSTKPNKSEAVNFAIPSTSGYTENKAVKLETNKRNSPSLLSPLAKLEPLAVNLAATLPDISPNYRPLPKNNINPIEKRKEEERMLYEVMSMKNQRTKVYSGNKSAGYSEVPTLFDICIRLLIDHIDDIEQTGGIPYYILKPVLQRATPDQLFNIEHHNPYLIEDTDELWQFHCQKRFYKCHEGRLENEPWRETFMRCIEMEEAKLKGLTEGIKKKMNAQMPVRTAKLAYVDHIVKPPRNVLRNQVKYGTGQDVPKPSNDNKKKLLIHSATNSTNVIVPNPVRQRSSAATASTSKKAKAPLMMKTLQLLKGRYKR